MLATPDGPGDLAAPLAQGWRTVIVLGILYWLAILDRQLMSLLGPDIKADLKLTDVQLSLIQGPAFALFYLFGGVPIGWAVDRFSRRWIIFWGVVVWSVSSAASGLSRSFPILFASRAGVGAGEASLTPAAYSILGDAYPAGRVTLALSLFVLGGNLGSAVSFILGGAAIGWLESLPAVANGSIGMAAWQIVFLMVGIPGVLIGLGIFLIAEPPRRAARTETVEKVTMHDLGRQLADHAWYYVAHYLAFGLIGAAVIALQGWTPVFLAQTYHWPISKIGLWLGTGLLIASALGLVVHGRIVDHFFRKGVTDIHVRYQSLLCVIAAPLVFFAYRAANPETVIVMVSLFYFCLVAFASIGPGSLVVGTPSRLRGKASSVALLFNTLISMAAGPVAVAAITDYVYRDEAMRGMSLSVFGVGCMIGAALLLIGSAAAMRRAVAAMDDGVRPELA